VAVTNEFFCKSKRKGLKNVTESKSKRLLILSFLIRETSYILIIFSKIIWLFLELSTLGILAISNFLKGKRLMGWLGDYVLA